MKQFLFFLIILATFKTQAAPDFIEGQMKYKITSEGKKDFEYNWNENDGFLKIRMGLVWDNYESELHKDGFDLSSRQDFYLMFPDAPENCSLYKAYGEIPGEINMTNNNVFLEYMGKGCLAALADFSLGTFVVHFYEVNSWSGLAPKTTVFRLQIWDHAP